MPRSDDPAAASLAPPADARTPAPRSPLRPVVRQVIGLAAAWIATRALLIAFLTGTVPYPDGPSLLDDVRLYAEWSNLLVTGRFPIGDDMWQYPPGAGAVFALSALIGDNPVRAFMGLAVAADLAVTIVLAIAGRRRRRGLAAAWTWVIAGALIGPVLLARFDVFPTLAAVVALILVARPVASGAAMAVGALLKVWPAFLLLALPRRALPRGIAGFAVTVALGLGLASLVATGGVSFLGEQEARGLQVESVGAWPFMVAQAFGADIPQEFRFGSMELDIPVTVPIGLAITILGFAVLALIGIARLAGRLDHLPAGDVALAVLLVSVVTSRVLSPQYSVWIAGVAAVTVLDRRSTLRPALWLLAVSIAATQVVYPLGYGSFLAGDAWAVAVQSIRILTLLAATAICLVPVARAALTPARRAPAAAPGSGG